MRVLHVAEAWGGGVVSAVHAYALSLPSDEHRLLVRSRSGHDTGDENPANTTMAMLPADPVRAIAKIREQVRAFGPDLVHAHSSLAGLYVRLAVNRRRVPVVYTPHCYAFERTDVGSPVRAVFRTVERALMPRTSVVVAVSEREAELARLLSSRVPAVHVPNIADPVDAVSGGSSTRVPRVVLGVGRLLPQKDPDFFADVARLLRLSVPSASMVWIGDGPQAMVRRLIDAGVDVVGWEPRSEVLTRMRNAGVYLHTAAWEGAPLTILEAVAAGTPVVARDIPALVEVPGLATGRSPQACADLVARVLSDHEERDVVRSRQKAAIDAVYSLEVQRERLTAAYQIAMSGVDA